MAPSTLGTFLRSFSFRPRPSARPGDRRDLAASLGTRGRAKGPSRPRRRLDDLSGRREATSRAPATATPRSSVTTRCSRRGPIPARCSMPACARARPTPPVGRGASSRSSSHGAGGPGRPARSCCGSTRGSGPTTRSRPSHASVFRYTMAVRTGNRAIATAIAEIEEDAWVGIDYTEDGIAEVAETTYKEKRLIVRRTRLVGAQEKLWPDWRHFGFLTDLDGDRRRARRLPPRPRPCRARHQGPERRCRDGARPLRALLRQLRLAVLRGARPRSRALVCLPGRHRRQGRADSRPARFAPVTSPCLLASSIARASRGFVVRTNGPGPTPSSKRWESFASSISLLAERPSRTGAAADVHLCADNQAEQDSLVDYAPTPVDRHPRGPSAATALYRSAAGVNR